MGRNNKTYSKNLHQQAYDRLKVGMQALVIQKRQLPIAEWAIRSTVTTPEKSNYVETSRNTL